MTHTHYNKSNSNFNFYVINDAPLEVLLFEVSPAAFPVAPPSRDQTGNNDIEIIGNSKSNY